jgi:deoxyribonuclease (pyrimidine dimer)
MTRINLLPVAELSDQHLMAEYRELPRIVNAVLEGRLSGTGAPKNYVLGTGHVKFFANKIDFLYERYNKIWNELVYRGFDLNPEFSPEKMNRKIKSARGSTSSNYKFSETDISLSRKRIIEKIMKKPEFYKWTRRKIPNWLKGN